MAAMVRRIQVHPVPALREAYVGHDARRARLRRHRARAGRARAQRRQAGEGQRALARAVAARARRGVADQHAEAGRERGDRAAVVRVGVVHRDAAGAALEAAVGHLRDAVEAAVAGAEEERLRPVIGEVVGKGAGAAGGLRGEVVVDGVGEPVAAAELVQVARGGLAWGKEAGGVDCSD